MATKNFSDAEIACKCGCGMLPDPEFMARVQVLRDQLGFAMSVNSAARCPAHNNRVSGTGNDGPHTTGRAIDLGVRGAEAYKVLREAIGLGFTGIGVSQKGGTRFIHLDDLPEAPNRPRPWVWSY